MRAGVEFQRGRTGGPSRIGSSGLSRMKISLVVVCHHSSEVLPGCVESFRHQAETAGLASEVVVVEHSEDDREASAVRSVKPDTLLVKPNRGYAAGLNTGVTEATGDVVFLANPDIEFLDGSVGALADAVAGGADVAGPQLVRDRGGTLFLPIPDDPSPLAELRRTMVRRWPTRGALERTIQASWDVWASERPCSVPSLRGSLLALQRDTIDWIGPLDEGYFLYYEETEWLWRARKIGAKLIIAPGARVVHRWGHATRRHEDSAAVEEHSRERFFKRNYSRSFRALLRLVAPRVEAPPLGFVSVDGPSEIPATEADIWLVSLVHQMQPAIGCLRVSELPSVLAGIEEVDRWYAVAAKRDNRRWRQQGRWTWERR